ncbi:MAG: UDP-2,3-diacylglucosamine diphosphatase [Bacteroidota bacterium]
MSLEREKHFVNWLTSISDDVSELYILGDLFDFWFEYRQVVPKGYIRLLGKLAELADQGVIIHIFAGNHDQWYQDYFPNQIGAHIHFGPVTKTFFDRTYFLAHGDGLGPGDHGYKFLKKIVTHPLSKWLYARLHPNLGIGLALWFSRQGGNHHYLDPALDEVEHLGFKEFLYQFALDHAKKHSEIDTYIFGHRHLLIDDKLKAGPHIIILGDWIQYFSYLKISPVGEELAVFPTNQLQEIPSP